MSQFRWSAHSLAQLSTCDDQLRDLFDAVIRHPDLRHDIRVLEGRRSVERQRENVRKGVSQTMRSRHLLTPSLAVDVAPLYNGRVSWSWPLYYDIAPLIKRVAREMGVEVEWGGNWKTFKDGPHWQLARDVEESEWLAIGV